MSNHWPHTAIPHRNQSLSVLWSNSSLIFISFLQFQKSAKLSITFEQYSQAWGFVGTPDRRVWLLAAFPDMVLLVVGKTEAMQPSSSEAKGKTPINFTERDLFL